MMTDQQSVTPRDFAPAPRSFAGQAATVRRFVARTVAVVGLLAIIATACASTAPVATIRESASNSGQRIPTVVPETTSNSVSAESGQPTVEPSADEGPTSEPVVTEPDIAVPAQDVVATRQVVRVLNEYPHREDSFTQGLLLDADGRMFESTGSYGVSTTRLIEVDRLTGDPIRQTDATSEVWGEGLALIDDRFVQLTYRAKVAFVWDGESFDKIGEFRYDTAGWGLCYDDTQDRLVMSDGTSSLVFRDPDTFAPLGAPMPVLLDGVELKNINELECVNGRIWANVFLSDLIVEIDPANGAVVTAVDASALNQPRPFDSNAVLNGIAYDAATDTFLVTGKFWDTLYEVDFEFAAAG